MASSPPVTRPPYGQLKHLIRYARPHGLRVLLLVPVLLVQTAFVMAVPIAVRYIFDDAIGQGDLRMLFRIVGGLIAGFALVVVAGLLQGYLAADLGMRIMNDLRLAMFAHLQRLSVAFFARAEPGDLMVRFTNDLMVVERAVMDAFYKFVQNVLIAVLSVGLLFWFDWRLALMTLLVLPLVALGPRLFGGRASRAIVERRNVESRLMGLLREQLGGQKIIRAFGLEPLFLNRFKDRASALRTSGTRAGRFGLYVERFSTLGMVFVQLLVIGLGAYYAIQGHLTSGIVIGFVGVLFNLGDSIALLSTTLPGLIQAAAATRRIHTLFEEPQVLIHADDADPLPTFSREIRFDHVSFAYDGHHNSVENLTLSIPAGQSVAFVGRSGSGKSTVLNLIARFYDPTTGALTLDGRDLKQIARNVLRRQMGAVFQDNFLFETTVRENIRMGRLDAADREVEDAARAAEVHDAIAAMPQGYDTVVGETGNRLSGGQRQRIALARAILRNPALLMLDEATMALDPATERAVHATLEKLARNRTVISVTHRLSTAAGMDRIFVLEDGRLAEAGTHKDLLNRKGLYFQMWQDFTLEMTREALIGDIEEKPDDLEVDASAQVQELREEVQRLRYENHRLERLNGRWTALAGTDRLTGLPNKLAFLRAMMPQEIHQAARSRAPIGFILISGDNLGPINQTYGREVGDQVLRDLAVLLKNTLKGEEQLGHLDGTNFAVTLYPATRDAALERAETLCKEVSDHVFICEGHTLNITISAGVLSLDSAGLSASEEEIEDAFRRLNSALYRAKKTGGNCVEAA